MKTDEIQRKFIENMNAQSIKILPGDHSTIFRCAQVAETLIALKVKEAQKEPITILKKVMNVLTSLASVSAVNQTPIFKLRNEIVKYFKNLGEKI